MKLNWQQWVAITIFFIIAFSAAHICAFHPNWWLKTASIAIVIIVYAFYDLSGIWRKIRENLDED